MRSWIALLFCSALTLSARASAQLDDWAPGLDASSSGEDARERERERAREREREEADRIELAHTARPTPDDRMRSDLAIASGALGGLAGVAGVSGVVVWAQNTCFTLFASCRHNEALEQIGASIIAGGGALLALALGVGLTSLPNGHHRAVEPHSGTVAAFYVVSTLLAAGGTALAIVSAAHANRLDSSWHEAGAVGSAFLLPLATGMFSGVAIREASASGAAEGRVHLEVGLGTLRVAWW